MKRYFLLLLSSLLSLSVGTTLAENPSTDKSDYRSAFIKEGMSKKERKQAKRDYEKERGIKTGWNFGPFPAISYNSDLGFQYGALCDIFYYGDGHQYPDYQHKINVEISHYTKGELCAHFL